MENKNSWGNDTTGDFEAELIALFDKRFKEIRGSEMTDKEIAALIRFKNDFEPFQN